MHRVPPYSPERLFDLAAGVEQYPQFLPWWVVARVGERDGEVYYMDQVIQSGRVRERFSSKTALRRRSESMSVRATGRSAISTWSGPLIRFSEAAVGLP